MTLNDFFRQALKLLFGPRSNSGPKTKIVNVINNENNNRTSPRNRGGGQRRGGSKNLGKANNTTRSNAISWKHASNPRPQPGKMPPPLKLETNPKANTKPHGSRVETSQPADPQGYFSKQGRYDHIQSEEELERAFANDLLDGSSKFLMESHPLLRDGDKS